MGPASLSESSGCNKAVAMFNIYLFIKVWPSLLIGESVGRRGDLKSCKLNVLSCFLSAGHWCFAVFMVVGAVSIGGL